MTISSKTWSMVVVFGYTITWQEFQLQTGVAQFAEKKGNMTSTEEFWIVMKVLAISVVVLLLLYYIFQDE